MKAAVCYEFNKPWVVEDVDIDPPKKGEVKVRLAATAICHSDIHACKGEMADTPPFVGGHESAGYIEEVGEDVTSVKPGDPVVASLLASCGKCLYCLTGLPHLCEVMAPFGDPKKRVINKKGQRLVQAANIGSFAEYTVIDESQVVKVPKDMPLDRAALLACGFITGFGAVVNRAQIKPLSSVVIIGTGGVGISAVQGAALSGAYPIIAVDILDNKVEASRTFGATHTLNSKKKDAIEAVKELTSGRGADYAFVTVGNIDAIRQGFSMVGTRGTAVIVGVPAPAETITLSPLEFLGGEKTLTACQMGSTNLRVHIPKLVALYKAGFIKLDEMITGRYPLEQINEAQELVERGEALRNVIVF